MCDLHCANCASLPVSPSLPFDTDAGHRANAVIFGVLNALILRPLNMPQAENLFVVQHGSDVGPHSYPDYLDLRRRNRSFDDVAVFAISQSGLDTGKDPSNAWQYETSGNYFDALRVQPYLGRFFHASDEHGPNSSFDRLPVANIDVGPANSLHTSNCLDLFGYLRSTRKIAVGNHNMSPPLRSQQSHLTSDPAAPTNDQSSPPAKLLLRRPPANCAYPLNHFAKPFTAVRRN